MSSASGGIAVMLTSASCWTTGSSTSMWHSPTSIALWLGRQVAGRSQCILITTEAISTMTVQRYSWLTRAVTIEFTAHTMLTCTSPQLLTMLQLCTILHQLRITQRLLWKLTSVTVLQTTPWPATHHAMVTTMQVTLDADKDSVLPLHMPFKRTRGILRNGSSLSLSPLHTDS